MGQKHILLHPVIGRLDLIIVYGHVRCFFEPLIRSTPIGLQSLLGRLLVCTFEAELYSFLVYKLQGRIIEIPSSL